MTETDSAYPILKRIVAVLLIKQRRAQAHADTLHNDDWTQGRADGIGTAISVVRRIGGLEPEAQP